jgi:hypothetical protein
MDKKTIGHSKNDVHKINGREAPNVISFMMETSVGLYFSNPYERALYIQQKERERREAREQAKLGTLFPLDLTDEEWDLELERRSDWDPDVA